MGDFQKMYDDNKDKGLQLLMVNGTDGQRETAKNAMAYFEKNGYTMPIYFDEAISGKDGLTIEDSANVNYRITGYPTTAFIDAEGNVMGVYTGVLDRERLQKLVDFVMDSENVGKNIAEAFK